MSLVGRLGLAIGAPRDALAIAGTRRNAGRSGSDLLAAIAILLVATELRWLVKAVWLGATVDVMLGVRALVEVLTGTLAIDLGLLAVAAAIIAFAGRLSRELGRAFDLACVAVLPLVFVDLVAGVIAAILDVTPLDFAPADSVRWGIIALAYGWTAWLVVIAVGVARGTRGPEARTTRAGWIVVALAAIGIAAQLLWVADNADLVRPQAYQGLGPELGASLAPGSKAPPIALPRVGLDGRLGERVSFAPGKVTVIDFWATWCGPCRLSLPALDRFAREHPEIDVLTINIDDPVEAREIFNSEHYVLTLLADDGATSARYGVDSIPRELLIDTDGTIVDQGPEARLEREITRLRH